MVKNYKLKFLSVLLTFIMAFTLFPANLVEAVNQFGNDVNTVPKEISFTKTTSSITMTWKKVSGAYDYDVEADGKIITGITANSFTENNLAPKSIHYYRVKANSFFVKGDWSEKFSSYTNPNRPDIPKNIKGSISNSSVTLTWDAAESTASYDIEIDGNRIVSCTNLTYVIEGLNEKTDHKYRIRSKNITGSSEWSDYLNATTLPNPPSLPSDLSINSQKDSITLNWKYDKEVIKFEIEADGQVIDNGTKTSFAQTGLLPNTEHSYRIRVSNAGGNSGWSSVIKSKTQVDSLAIPNFKKPAIAKDSIKLSWDKVENASSYEIVVDGKIINVSNNLEFKSDGLSPSSEHHYFIRSISNSGTSNWSNPIILSTLPDTPQNINTISTKNSIVLTWKSVYGATGYDVEKDGQIVDNQLRTTFMDSGLEVNSNHNYRVRAKNETGDGEWSKIINETTLQGSGNPQTSANSSQAVVNPQPLVPKPSVIIQNPQASGNLIQQERNNGINPTTETNTSNVIETNGPQVEKIKKYVNSVESDTQSPRANRTLSLAKVAGTQVQAGGICDENNTLTLSASTDTAAPTAPTGLEASAITSRTFTLSWTAATDNLGVTQYDIFKDNVNVGSTTELSYKITGVSPGTTCSFKVKARDAAGNISDESVVLSVTTLEDTEKPTVVTGLTASEVSCTSFKLSWSPAEDNVEVAGYDIYIYAVYGEIYNELIGSTTELSYTIKGLPPGTTCSFRVKARDAAGNISDESVVLSVTTLEDTEKPTVVTGLTASEVSYTSFKLSWSPAEDNVEVAGYDIYIYAVYGEIYNELIGSTTELSYTIKGLPPGTTCSFRVKARDAAGNISDESVVLSVTTLEDTEKPTVVTGLTASEVSYTSFKLSWSPAEDNVEIAGYDIYIYAVYGEIYNELIGSTTELSYTIKGLPPGTTCSFKVKVRDAAGNISDESVVLSVTTLEDTEKPTVVTGLTASEVSYTSFKLSWSPAEDNVEVAGYDIYIYAVYGEIYNQLIGSTTELSYTIKGLPSGTTCSFKVKARDAAENISDESVVLSVTTLEDTEKPTVVTGLTASEVSYTSFKLSWSPAEDNVEVAGYDIYIYAVYGEIYNQLIGSTTELSYTIKGLPPGTTCSFKVKVRDAAGNISDESVVLSVTTLEDTEKPTAPTDLTASQINCTSFELSWSVSEDNVEVTGYDIYIDYVLIGSTAELSYNITDLSPDTMYSFKVKAKDEAGNVSAGSNALSVTTTADTQAPTEPTGLVSSAVDCTSFTLTWTAATDNVGVIGYDIYNGVTKIGSTNEIVYYVIGLDPNSNNSFTIKARDASGNVSGASNALPVATLADTQAPTPPTGLVAVADCTTVTLSWTASTDDIGVTGYDIYNGDIKVDSFVTSTTYVVTGLSLNNTYRFTVKARDAAGNISDVCTALSVTTLADTQAPTAPKDLTASSISCTALTIKWTASTDNLGVVGYDIYNGSTLIQPNPYLNSTSMCPFYVIGLNPNTTYSFTVRAKDAAGNVSVSAPLLVTTPKDTEAPSTPSIFRYSQIDNSTISLYGSSGSDNVGVTECDIYKDNILIGSTPDTSFGYFQFKATGLALNTTYNFTIKAKDAAGNVSIVSTGLSVNIGVMPPPPSTPALSISSNIDLPTVVQAGQTYIFHVTITNTGSMTWDEAHLIRIFEEKGSFPDYPLIPLNLNNFRLYLPSGITVSTGQSYTWTITATAPTVCGTYACWFCLIDDGSSSIYNYTEFNYGKINVVEPVFNISGADGTYQATGNFTKSYTDFTICDNSNNINFVRSYNSQDTTQGTGFGMGWSFSYECRIKDTDSTGLYKTAKLTDGTFSTFYTNADGSFIAIDSRNQLSKSGDGYNLTTKDQHTYFYNSAGYLVWIKDRYGNIVNISVDVSEKVRSITDGAARNYTFLYNSSGLIESITDPYNRTVRYEYENNKLLRVYDSIKHVTRYSYDSFGFINGIVDNDSNPVESIVYCHDINNRDFNKVLTTKDIYNNVNTYKYNLPFFGTNETQILDANGRETIIFYGSCFNISSIFEGITVGETDYTYSTQSSGIDSFDEIQTVTDRNGNTTTYVRDSNGNITTQTNPDKSTKAYLYDNKNNLTQIKDENGNCTYFIYDGNGIYLLKKVQPLNGTDAYSSTADQNKFAITQYIYYTDSEAASLGYKVKGLLKQVIDPNGSTINYAYDSYGNVRTITDGEKNTTSYEYNIIGWKTCVTSPKGFKTNYKYDNDGNVIAVVLNGGETTRTVYDSEGRKIKEVSANLYNSNLDDLKNDIYSGDVGTRYTYNTNGKVQSIKDAENNVTSFTYDMYGNILTVAKPDGSIYSYDYDKINRILNEYYQENGSVCKKTLACYVYSVYSAYLPNQRWNVNKAVYLNNTDIATTIVYYDYAGRVVEQDNPDGTKEYTTYNANGTKATSTDARESVTYYNYNKLNKFIEQWTPVELNNGNILFSYTKTDYDNGGRVIDKKTGIDKVALNSIPTNFMTVNYTYYGNNKLKSQINSNNRRTDYVYDADGNLSKQTVYADANTQETTEYQNNYLEKHDIKIVHIRKGDIYGNNASDISNYIVKTSYSYDKDGNVKTMTTADGTTTTYGYDNLDRQISVSQPGLDQNGNTATITITKALNYSGKVLMSTDANKNATYYVYDGRGNLIRTIDAKGNTSASYYDTAGRKIADVNCSDYIQGKHISTMNRTEYSYDLMGRLITIKSVYFDNASSLWKNIVTKAYAYDASGNVIKELDALGYESGTGSTSSAIISSGYGTETTYNLANKVSTILASDTKDRGLAYTVSYTYDGLGRKVSETNAAGAVTTYYYDNAGNLLKTTVKKDSTSAEQIIKISTYDLAGNITTVTDGNGKVTTYEYNQMNKVRKVTYPGDSTIAAYTISYQYDVMGNLKQTIDSLGKVTMYTYDNQGRLLSTTEQASDGSSAITTSTRYDRNGNKRFVLDGNGNTTENTYDELNRLVSTLVKVTSNGNTTTETITYGYDAKGNKTSVTDWMGNVTQYIYDPLNRLIKKIDAYGKTIESLEYYDNGAQSKSYDALNNCTQYFYDKNKKLIKTIDPENHVTLTSYDALGNTASKTDGDNNVTRYFYDEFNNVVKVINANNETTSYTYDLNGNMLSQTDGRGNTSLYEYNVANKLIRRIDNGGRAGNDGSYSYDASKTESYIYYADGNLKSKTDRNGLVTNYNYDIHGRKLSMSVGSINISYTYDNNGNQLTISDSTGTTTRTYDELNRVISKTVPSIGKSNYAYDIITGMDQGTYEESSTDPLGNITLKVYDKNGRLSKVIADGNTTTYSYYDNGSLASVIYPNGSGEYYTYYNDNLLKTLTNKKSDGTVIDSYSYIYDGANNITSKTDIKGATGYSYDKLNRLYTVTEPDGTVITYSYDAAGNRLMETVVRGSTTTVTAYNYNDQNRLISSNTTANGVVTQTVSYTYDNNGSQLTYVTTPYVNGVAGTVQTTTNTYDELNELIQTVNPDGTNIVNIYNGEGLRVAKATSGVIRRYLYEGDKVVLELDVNGILIARNVYGTNLISRTVNGVKGYYFYNGHADVTNILGEDGTILATYYYDEFGVLKNSTGTFDNPFRYAGYQYDSETGTYYLIARMYDPTTGRFLQEDSYRGQTNDPLSLNLYTYCKNEPVMYNDPSGHVYLCVGSSGSDVVVVQEKLIAEGYSCGKCGVDGDYGAGTKAAVTQYQKNHGLQVDGEVGDETWGSLFVAPKSSPLPKPSNESSNDSWGEFLQSLLNIENNLIGAFTGAAAGLETMMQAVAGLNEETKKIASAVEDIHTIITTPVVSPTPEEARAELDKDANDVSGDQGKGKTNVGTKNKPSSGGYDYLGALTGPTLSLIYGVGENITLGHTRIPYYDINVPIKLSELEIVAEASDCLSVVGCTLSVQDDCSGKYSKGEAIERTAVDITATAGVIVLCAGGGWVPVLGAVAIGGGAELTKWGLHKLLK